MKKALLVGNGFSSQYISAYRNDNIVQKFKDTSPLIYSRIDACFEPFRKGIDRYTFYVSPLRSGTIMCGRGTGLRAESLNFSSLLVNHIKKVISEIGFSDSVFNEYFIGYGLIHQTQKDHVEDIESLIKIAFLFKDKDLFTTEDILTIKDIANNIMYNNGKIGIDGIDNPNVTDIVKDNLSSWINNFEYIYSTNYDDLIDDYYNKQVFHIHGGFHYDVRDAKLYKNISKRRLDLQDAFLTWGISGEDKMSLIAGFSFSKIVFSKFTFAPSIFQEYLDSLSSDGFEELHIYGYSGENDGHINERIARNNNIKRIVYYYYPESIEMDILKYKVENQYLKEGIHKEIIYKSHKEVEKIIFG